MHLLRSAQDALKIESMMREAKTAIVMQIFLHVYKAEEQSEQIEKSSIEFKKVFQSSNGKMIDALLSCVVNVTKITTINRNNKIHLYLNFRFQRKLRC